jgi:uncharacterized protein
MEYERIISILKTHEVALRAEGVVGISLFGSAARGESSAQDVDLAVRLSTEFSKPGLDYFGRLEELEKNLAAILGCEVDVIEEPVPAKRFQAEIDRDRAVAF